MAVKQPKSGAGKTSDMSIVLPKKLVSSLKSRINPKESVDPGGKILNNEALYGLYNTSISQVRNQTNPTALLRFLARSEGPLATAVHNLVQVASTEYTAMAYNTADNTFSPEGSDNAESVIAQLDTLYDYTAGFSIKRPIDETIQMLLRECVLTNGCAAEMVLNEFFLPDRIQVVPLETVEWRKDPKGKKGDPNIRILPAQIVTGQSDPVILDIPTFWVHRMPGDPTALYPSSMLEASIKLLIYFEEFLEDIRRSVRGSGHARQVITLDLEKIKNAAPPAIRSDVKKLTEWCTAFRDTVQSEIEKIEPEDALVLFDTTTYKFESANFGTKTDYTPMMSVISAMAATAMKTPPSAIGMRVDGASGVASVESMIFLKSASALHAPVEGLMSRLLTLACRLRGVDVYVKFKFDPCDLRPKLELESFLTMKYQRIYNLLQYGFITDDEAAYMLGMGRRPPGAPPLMGTEFQSGGSAAAGADNLPIRPGDTPAGKALQPDKKVPRKAGGRSQ